MDFMLKGKREIRQRPFSLRRRSKSYLPTNVRVLRPVGFGRSCVAIP